MDWSPHLVVQSGHLGQPTCGLEIKHLPDEYIGPNLAHFKEHIHAHLPDSYFVLPDSPTWFGTLIQYP